MVHEYGNNHEVGMSMARVTNTGVVHLGKRKSQRGVKGESGRQNRRVCRSQPVKSTPCLAEELSFMRSHVSVTARRMERTFQQNVKDAPEEQKKAGDLGGSWGLGEIRT